MAYLTPIRRVPRVGAHRLEVGIMRHTARTRHSHHHQQKHLKELLHHILLARIGLVYDSSKIELILVYTQSYYLSSTLPHPKITL